MLQDVEGIALAVGGGVASSIVNFTFGRLVLKPRLHLPEELRIRDYAGKQFVQVELFNASPLRSITDIRIAAIVRIEVPDSDPQNQSGHSVVRVPLEVSSGTALRLEALHTRILSLSVGSLTPFTLHRLLSIRRLESGAERTWNNEEEVKALSVLDLLDILTSTAEVTCEVPKLVLTLNYRAVLTGRDFSLASRKYTRQMVSYGSFAHIDESERFPKLDRKLEKAGHWVTRRLPGARAVPFHESQTRD